MTTHSFKFPEELSQCFYKSMVTSVFLMHHSFSAYVKFSEKIQFLTPCYVHIRVRIRGYEMLTFWKILHTF